MNCLHRIDRALRVVLLVVISSSCLDQGELFGPRPEPVGGAPRLQLAETSYSLYAGDQVLVRVQGWDGGLGGQAEILVLGVDRDVVWRSPAVPVTDTVVRVPVVSVPTELFAREGLVLTAALQLRDGRVYATDDTIAEFTREDAAVRPVRFFRGQVVALSGGSVLSFALDPVGGRLFFAAGDRAQIGVLDLRQARELRNLDVPTGPIALRFFKGALGALVADGTELAVFDGEADVPPRRVLLPTLAVEAHTRRAGGGDSVTEVDTFTAVVRPYGLGLAWGCVDLDCSSPVAFSPSQLSGPDAPAGMIRRIPVLGDALLVPLVLPQFQAGLLGDSVPSRVRVWAADRAGADSLVFDSHDRGLCAVAGLGGPVFDVAPDGDVLYVAVPARPCFEGTALVRVDHPASAAPRVNSLARRNLAGDDRIGSVDELRVSPDGAFVLVRSEDRIHLLDAELRLRATIPASSPTAIAWIEGDGLSSHFAIAAADGVALYDTARRVVVARLPLGATRDGLLVLWRSGDEMVAVAAPRDRAGVVAARVPAP